MSIKKTGSESTKDFTGELLITKPNHASSQPDLQQPTHGGIILHDVARDGTTTTHTLFLDEENL